MDHATAYLRHIVAAQGRGEVRGIYSVCTADPLALRAAMEQAVEDGTPALIEATSNQVNQDGGYTGMQPEDFVAFVEALAREVGLRRDQLILGGDHLGPNPWRHERVEVAMARGCELVEGYVAAGFVKIHLDASMPLGDDPAGKPLAPEVVAQRTAQLCLAAERGYQARHEAGEATAPLYVIGSDVPPPGGAATGEGGPQVTTPEEFETTVALTRQAFLDHGLEEAWNRVIAVVVQPGVEFGEWQVYEYDRTQAAPLSQALRKYPGIAFEGHSTDYQTPERLREMAQDGIVILKVGPALTFAKREALYALSALERELVFQNGLTPAAVPEVLDRAMLADPRHWQTYYGGDERELALKRRYGLSDRCRYYWPVPEVREAVERLLANLRAVGIPLPLLSQVLPRQYDRVRAGRLALDPEALVIDRIRDVLRGYAFAVGTGRG